MPPKGEVRKKIHSNHYNQINLSLILPFKSVPFKAVIPFRVWRRRIKQCLKILSNIFRNSLCKLSSYILASLISVEAILFQVHVR